MISPKRVAVGDFMAQGVSTTTGYCRQPCYEGAHENQLVQPTPASVQRNKPSLLPVGLVAEVKLQFTGHRRTLFASVQSVCAHPFPKAQRLTRGPVAYVIARMSNAA